MTHPFTPTYIVMCKASGAIQEQRTSYTQFQPGEWFLDMDNQPSVAGVDRMKQIYIGWLPRLDQLLGMVGTPCTFVHAIAHAGDGPGIYFNWDSEEEADWHELALAVVMREKHGKTWRDGKWVK